MPAAPTSTLRVLAGTGPAVRLAEAAAARFGDRLQVAVTLAGTGVLPHGCRVDSIGGAAPLDGAAAVIDGLDPFARTAVRAAREAVQRAGIPRLAFRPPAWFRHPLDRWVEVRDVAGAADAVASVARTAVLALPERDLDPFEAVGGLRFAVRLTRPPPQWSRPSRFVPHCCPPPHSREAELCLLRRAGAQAVVMRATGAAEDLPLVLAARALDLPVVMVRRPVERGEVPARSIAAALDWVAVRLDGLSPAGTDVPAWR